MLRCRQSVDRQPPLLCTLILFLIAAAREDGKPRILWEARVAIGELTEQKHGTAIGIDKARVNTIGAKSFVRNFFPNYRGLRHKESLAGVC